MSIEAGGEEEEEGGRGVTQVKRIAGKNTPSRVLLKPLSVSRIRMLCKLPVQLIER